MTDNQHLSPEFAARARVYWTAEREAKVTGRRTWPVMPGAAAPLLRVLGLLNADASISADAVRKLSQINHMVTLLLPQMTELAERLPVVRIFDAGCGTSALTLIVGWLFRERFAKPVQVLGIDSNPSVIATSKRRAEALGLSEQVRFLACSLAEASWAAAYREAFGDPDADPTAPAPRPNLVLGLHACDTATDLAAALGVAAEADVVALAPCCHAELARKWKDLGATEVGGAADHPFEPIFQSPNLRRETAAQITDAMRMLLLRGRGYEVTATEFVPSAHTPKNRLLLCTRRGRYLDSALKQYEALRGSLGGAGIALEGALPPLTR